MNIILYDDAQRIDLLPLSYTRPCCELRVGIFSIREKWERLVNADISYLTEQYLSKKYPVVYSDHNLYINGRLLPEEGIAEQVLNLQEDEALYYKNELLAICSAKSWVYLDEMAAIKKIDTEKKPQWISQVYDIFSMNGIALIRDFNLITKGRKSAALPDNNTLIGDQLFVEEGARVEACVLNSKEGPIYIGKNAEIMEGSLIRGPFALCDNAVVKMGAKVYGPTTIGPYCKVGGEISNTVFQSYSNKGHDGFLGNSVIGEWCNIGADSNSSNLKNNYATVKLWNFSKKRFVNTNLQFCGLIMGDHSKCGINTMFNTGTVVGISANIFGTGFPRNFIPSFTWGGSTGYATYGLDKVFETANKVMERRKMSLSETDKKILKHIFEISSEHRFWENHTSRI